jgi:uncharacterized repeat protein (TIGR03803 family)
MGRPCERRCVKSEVHQRVAGCALLLAAAFFATAIPAKSAVAQADGSSSVLDTAFSYQADENTGAKFTVLHSFTGGADGGAPHAGLVSDAAGNLYGTTQAGGKYGYGTVFKIDVAGKETVLHSFKSSPDGALPAGDLLLASDGTLYGTTACGGVKTNGNTACASGHGTVFKVDKTGKYSIVYSFRGGTTDGGLPVGGLAQDKIGNLYGTTMWDGAGGVGVVFKLDEARKETILHAFGGAGDIGDPTGDVTLDAQGNLFGTGWSSVGTEGRVWKITKANKETVLYLFTGGVDGGQPMGGVVLGINGDLYGTASEGGAYNSGVLFRLNRAGDEEVLYSFGAWPDDGTFPNAAPVLDSAGNLYGTTVSGGYASSGIVYKINKTGKETVLHSFEAGNDGGQLYGRVMRDSSGNLYGATVAYGKYGQGVVFKFSPK